MNRRGFLRMLGAAPVGIPAAVTAVTNTPLVPASPPREMAQEVYAALLEWCRDRGMWQQVRSLPWITEPPIGTPLSSIMNPRPAGEGK